MGGPSAAVVNIEEGCPILLAGGLPSSRDAMGAILGAADVAILDGEIYTLVAGGGASHGNPDQPNGVYRVETDGTATLVADIGQWHRDNPVSAPVGGYEPDANVFSMIAHDGALWFVESNSAYVGTVTSDGTITRIADLSDDNMVPTAITASPDGGIFIGYLTEFPFLDGTSKVSDLAPDGTATDIGTGLSMVTGLAVGDDGTLYAVEIATGDPTGPQDSQFLPMTGRSVRQTSQDSLEPVVICLTLPVSLDTDVAGLLYTSVPAIGADAGTGMVVSFDVSAGGVTDVATSLPMANPCDPLDTSGGTGTPDAAATPVA
ncbi:MAG: ScyD/ScyE family protein [Chloroflexia bacterium]|nr:ScyD/ScyE family protein [Chloroflexia bacterium]